MGSISHGTQAARGGAEVSGLLPGMGLGIFELHQTAEVSGGWKGRCEVVFRAAVGRGQEGMATASDGGGVARIFPGCRAGGLGEGLADGSDGSSEAGDRSF